MSKTILIADDDSTVTQLFSLNAESNDADLVIRSSETGEDTIAALSTHKPDILILDIRMPKGDGFVVLEHIKKHKLDIPVIILTNYRNETYVEKSKTFSNVKEYIVKHEVRMERVFSAVHSRLA